MNSSTLLRRLGVVATAAALVAGLGACGSSADPGSGNTLNVVVTTAAWSVETGSITLADRLGFLREEGVQATFSTAKSGTEAAQQIIGGNADVAVATPEPVMIAAQQGTDLQYFMPFYGHVIYGLAAVPGSGIASVADLRGKRVGVTNANSTGATLLRTALKAEGMSEKDVTIVPIGVGAQQVTAVRGGDVDALAMYDTLYTSLRSQGIAVTDIPVPGLDQLFGGGLLAQKSALAENPEAYAKLGRAVAKALAWSRQHPEDAVRAVWDSKPETRPGPGQDEQKALEDGVAMIETRLGALIPDPQSTSWTEIDPAAVDRFADWALGAGLITGKPPVEDVLDSGAGAAIGDFTPSEVTPSAGS
ncbi:ABC transporter substrate-binding protein [Pseudonocardia sp. ICBG162]|uniref:ABC transporter substrate-binding protein n=1 Tax=Pseudonocardia sp. ICBG162 TaxID=2846761 RepID=UPI001CF685A4|nr:ABC transporter substrate-binding protein [Pseudonocardia sp. ICBG162]